MTTTRVRTGTNFFDTLVRFETALWHTIERELLHAGQVGLGTLTALRVLTLGAASSSPLSPTESAETARTKDEDVLGLLPARVLEGDADAATATSAIQPPQPRLDARS